MCSNKLVKESSKVFKQAGQGVEQGVQASWSRSRARCSSKLVKESSKVFKQAGQGVEQGVQASWSRSRARCSSKPVKESSKATRATRQDTATTTLQHSNQDRKRGV